ncbi:MAG: aspartyl protease family protein [Woeseiaceae bacterium]
MKSMIAGVVLALSLDASAAVSHWIPFNSEGGHISIPVTVNGVESRALLDSGAAGNGISERFLSEHEIEFDFGRQIIVSGVAGERKVRQINGLKVGMFGTEFEINQMMPVYLRNADVLIGLGFFNNFILQIDYPNSQLRIITHDSLKLKELANVRMKKAAGSPQPIVKVDMNGEANLWLTLDTGNNSGILIPRRSATRFDWLEKYGTSEARMAGATKLTNVERFNLPELTIGPAVLENVIVIVPGEGEKTNVGRDESAKLGTRVKQTSSDGILGYDVLKHFVVTIDYKRSYLHLGAPAEPRD